jgi:Ni/Fe-hydrogenase 1 B-type cytochrome subunit
MTDVGLDSVRKRLPADSIEAAEVASDNSAIYVWDRVVRLTHWLIAGSIVVLAATGWYIGRPFVTTTLNAEPFVTGTMRIIHFYAAIVFTLAVISRVIWAFISPLPYARWYELIPVHAHRLKAIWDTFLFYAFIKRKPPAIVGHNPLAGAAYAGMYVVYAVIILTGLGIFGSESGPDSWMHHFAFLAGWFGGLQMSRWYHHWSMWVVLVFVVVHLYTAILTARLEKNGTIDSIFSGFKFLPKRYK